MIERPILVVGKNGQLARSLRKIADERMIPLVAASRPELDIHDIESIDRIVSAVKPKAIVNTAAYTAVDNAESEPERVFTINRDCAARLATVAAKYMISFVHVSTDFVFDGAKGSSYTENDVPSPLSTYGRSKLEGEWAVSSAYRDALILRTSWVFSPFGRNFVKTMLALAQTREVVGVVDDQRGSPTAARDLAEAILTIVGGFARPSGLYHFACAGETTWHAFASAIFSGWAKRGHRVPVLNPITTAEYPTPARRPANSCLDCSKIQRDFGIEVPPWQKSLDLCLDDLALVPATSDTLL